ncbi:MAG: tetratricopeptide repeat protein [Alphaproteobacteria bacterium]|nr:tetratricopeptide repeat protein [Alphaproteobacteria bacterium]
MTLHRVAASPRWRSWRPATGRKRRVIAGRSSREEIEMTQTAVANLVAGLVVAGTIMVGGSSSGQSTDQGAEPLSARYRGIELIALAPEPGVDFGVGLIGQREGLDNVIAALDVIYQHSPFSVEALRTLQDNGNVILVYDTRYPDKKSEGHRMSVAIFLPGFFNREGDGSDRADFLVVIGRHGIKWPDRELAGIIVHELVGHGMQHLHGRMDYVRALDIECEAMLYEEKSYQDFGMDKLSTTMINFRVQLERYECSDFKAYMGQHQSSQMKLWDGVTPDVPRLLAIFGDYVDYLAEEGISQAAIGAAERLRDEELERIFEGGTPDQQFQVANRFFEGFGVARDPAEAAKWFRRAAEQGHAEAQYILGSMSFRGQGVPQDHAEAVKWYRRAAEQGEARAQTNLGFMYELGQGVPRDHAEAVKWYRLAAEQGTARAQTNLARMYAKGQGVPQDYAEAAKWYQRAAEQGNARAQTNLGRIYAKGQGVPRDYAEAAKWYRRAAEQGDATAQTNLGLRYEKGQGVAQDHVEAVKWYRRAAEQGNARAQTKLGRMYAEGQGVPRDGVQAYKWFDLAATHFSGQEGRDRAARSRDLVAAEMAPAQIAEAQKLAREWEPK